MCILIDGGLHLMKDEGNVVIFITTSTDEEAHKVAEALLEHRKAACVNIVPKVNSLFWWHDKIESSKESLVIIKTRESVLEDIIGLIKEIHSYDVPEIIALPIVGGNRDYLTWVKNEVQ